MPILWIKHTSEYVGQDFYECNSIIDAKKFSEEEASDVEFKTSELRKYLNVSDETNSGEFQKTTFSFSNSSYLSTMTLSDKSGAGYNSNVIVGSSAQYIEWNSTTELRKKFCTDYAVFKGAPCTGDLNTGTYWTNTVNENGSVDVITTDGTKDSQTANQLLGFSPVIRIDN